MVIKTTGAAAKVSLTVGAVEGLRAGLTEDNKKTPLKNILQKDAKESFARVTKAVNSAVDDLNSTVRSNKPLEPDKLSKCSSLVQATGHFQETQWIPQVVAGVVKNTVNTSSTVVGVASYTATKSAVETVKKIINTSKTPTKKISPQKGKG